jgi:hypothetical protein
MCTQYLGEILGPEVYVQFLRGETFVAKTACPALGAMAGRRDLSNG